MACLTMSPEQLHHTRAFYCGFILQLRAGPASEAFLPRSGECWTSGASHAGLAALQLQDNLQSYSTSRAIGLSVDPAKALRKMLIKLKL